VLTNGDYFGSTTEKRLKTTINGRVVQDDPIDLIWTPAELVSFLSKGMVPAVRLLATRK
jgi:2-keto-4-pentenoate hydratase/2-oxohepta-3-ene-1,7-dioic acid hydratase in catechol pathway